MRGCAIKFQKLKLKKRFKVKTLSRKATKKSKSQVLTRSESWLPGEEEGVVDGDGQRGASAVWGQGCVSQSSRLYVSVYLLNYFIHASV